MILNEKMLEDYFERNIDMVAGLLKDTFKFPQAPTYVGRQVNIGKSNRLDMLFYYDDVDDKSPENICRNYIVMELKFRALIPNDLEQLARYMDAVCCAVKISPHNGLSDFGVKGVLVGPCMNQSLGILHSHIIDNEEISIWCIADDMKIIPLEPYCLLCYLTDIDPDEIDSRFPKGKIVQINDSEE